MAKSFKDLYISISNSYNETSLCKEKGYKHFPNEYELSELKILGEKIRSGCNVLDVGTGMGIAPRFAKKLGANVITLDSYQASGSDAIENIKNEGIGSIFIDILNDKIPLDDNSIDIIFFGDVIEHLLHSPKRALLEFNRILKPNGVCIASTPNAVRLTVRIKVLLGYSNWSNLNDFWNEDFNSGHHHEYTLDEFRSVFLKTGFLIEKVIMEEASLKNETISKISDLKRQRRFDKKRKKEGIFYFLRKLSIFFVNIFPQLKSSMIIVAKKK